MGAKHICGRIISFVSLSLGICDPGIGIYYCEQLPAFACGAKKEGGSNTPAELSEAEKQRRAESSF